MKKRSHAHNNLTAYSFITPSAVLLLIFVIIPILMTFGLSFTNFNGLEKNDFIGIRNFSQLFQDKLMLTALKNTLRFVLATVPAQTVLSLGIAALVAANLRNRFGEFVRGAMFIPVLCSATLLASIFAFVFSSDPESLANTFMHLFGVEKVNWLGDPKIAPWVIIGIHVWKNIGYFIVIFYAGIMDIPNNLYEAAQIDGANKWQQFWQITVPNLKSIIFMVITVSTIWSFQFFDLSYVMTGGGPADVNRSLVHHIYAMGFKNYKFGYASAVSIVLFLFVVAINLIQNLIMKEED